MSRAFAADDADVIARRMAEIRYAEDRARGGCLCPSDAAGEVQHAAGCPLAPPSSETPMACPGMLAADVIALCARHGVRVEPLRRMRWRPIGGGE